MDAFSDVPVNAEWDADFDQAFPLLSRFVDLHVADQLQPLGAAAVYTTSVVLWLLVYQRMHRRASLVETVQYLREVAAEICPDNRRIREKTLSRSTAAYSGARERLTVETAEWFAKSVSESICATTQPSLGSRRVFILDGTTLTLAPVKTLQKLYPPASNQHGEGTWPVALLLVAHELESGAAMLPELGAMYGPQAVSETELARTCLQKLPAGAAIMTDSGFGIFAVAWSASINEHPFLMRLTAQRYHALHRNSTLREQGDGWATYSLVWSPSRHERQAHPDLPPKAALDVQLHEYLRPGAEPLYFVSDLPEDCLTLADLYRKRMDVETDIRNLKVVLELDRIPARSPEMFHKELLTSMVAYNLVVQFRRQAAELAKVPPRRLSFTNVWTIFRMHLLTASPATPAEWRERYRKSLHDAMQCKLPNRPGRSYPREAYSRAPKSTHFKKRKRPPDPPIK
jgi:hypothetical protein